MNRFIVLPYLLVTLVLTVLSLYIPEPQAEGQPTTIGIATESAALTPQHGGVIAYVTEVVDGDTFKVDTGHTVRYIGIDTPETQHPTKKQECYGKEAAEKNTALIAHRHVELVKDVSETDRYGRLLRYVWKDGVFINDQLVREGYAVARSYPPDIAMQDQLRTAEALASQAKRGLWGTTCKP